MEFPYASVRPFQEDMIKNISECLAKKKHIIIDAPTGIGKTVGSLLPAVEYALKENKTVFFLTSRLSQHKAAIDTLKSMRKSAGFTAIDLVGKKHLCSFDTKEMDSSSFSTFCSAMIRDKRCQFYKNFRSDVNEAERQVMLRMLENESPIPSQKVLALAGGRFCSYEMLMELSKKANVIVADYFHMFSPLREKLLKRTGRNIEDAIIIVDEAHALADRLRNHLSFKISTRVVELAEKEARDFTEFETADSLKNIKKALEKTEKSKLALEDEVFIEKEDFMKCIESVAGYDHLIKTLTELGERVLEERRKSHVDRVAAFLHAWKGEDYGYARIFSREKDYGKKKLAVYYNAMDPSIISRPVIHNSHSTILMSGTMSPMEMHRDILGLEGERTLLAAYESPFPKENRLNIVATHVTTRYKERSPQMFAKIAFTTVLCSEATKGNMAVFFPSYDIRDKVYDLVKERVKKHILLERPEMTKDEREATIDKMKELSNEGAVLFGVMGGSFSEGIDLPGDCLNGVIIVGLPLARPDLFTQALISYYNKRFGKGVMYAYTYPAMIKVLQAAGRCIRTETDRGVIVFCDKRFIERSYRYLFPSDFDAEVTDRPEIEIKRFFGN